MKIPREAQRMARKLFQICLDKNGSLNAATIKTVIAAILRDKPRFTVGILQRLHELCRLHLSQSTALISSASPLGAEGAKIKAQILSLFPYVNDVKFFDDPSLVAGLKIQVGSNVWDGTVKQKLKTLQEQLSN